MGLDYTYRLFFPRERVPEALEGLAARCAPPPRGTARIRLPQGIREFPFEPFREDALPNWDDESYSFDIILRLEADESLEKFTRIAPQQLEAQGGETALGYVYFRVDNPPDEAVSCFVFIAGGNRMSWAFLDSRSLQSAFSDLLAAHGGLCGLLDRDEDRIVFWWRGQATWETLREAWTLEEIDAQMQQALHQQEKSTRSAPRHRPRCRKK
jgi:hypothetical protein